MRDVRCFNNIPLLANATTHEYERHGSRDKWVDVCAQNSHLKITPQKGGLLVFFNKNRVHESDTRLMHYSCPTKKNSKYIGGFRED